MQAENNQKKWQGKQPEDSETKKKLPRKVDTYMKYSGMAFQMGAVMFIGIMIGKKLDEKLQTAKPYWTILFALLSTIAALYIILKDFIFKKKDE